jgi:heptose I phosphotransferase
MFELSKPLQDYFGGDFDAVMSVDGEVHRAKEGRRTVSFEHEGREYFAKVHGGIGWGEVMKNLLQFKVPVVDASNEWLAAERLQEVGVETVTIVGKGLRGANPATRDSFVIMDGLAERDVVEFLLKRGVSSSLRRMITHKVAETAKRMHGAGINHRDFYLCHFHAPERDWSEWTGEDDFVLPVMDLHRAQLRKNVPKRWIVKDLGALLYSAMDCDVSKREVVLFLKVYLGERWREKLREEESFWKAVVARGRGFYRKHCGKDPDFPW